MSDSFSINIGGTDVSSVAGLKDVEFTAGKDSIQARFAVFYMLMAKEASEKAEKTLSTLESAQKSLSTANDLLEWYSNVPLGQETSKDQTAFFKDVLGITNSDGNYVHNTKDNPDKLDTESERDFIKAELEKFINTMSAEVQTLNTVVNSEIGLVNTYISGAASTTNALTSSLKNIAAKF